MAILVDGSSASAAEIVSGAMQDMDRAVIIGEQTYGKGLVQTTRPIGYDSYLKVTTAKYYTPSGRCIQAREYDSEGNARKIPDSLTSEFKTQHGRIVRDGGGIKPDIELKDSAQFSTLVYKLYTENYIFNYVTEYCQKHKKPTSVDDITFDDKDFDDFKAFLTSKNFSYQLKSEKVFKDGQIVKRRGMRADREEVTIAPGKHDAIVSEEIFKAAQERFANNPRAKVDAPLKNPLKDKSPVNPMTVSFLFMFLLIFCNCSVLHEPV